jgi:HD-like signal output (HDOD) protein
VPIPRVKLFPHAPRSRHRCDPWQQARPSAATFGRLRARLENPATELPDIIGLIRLDPALTFRIIRLSNSVLFGLRTHNDSLDGAVARLGLRELSRVAGIAATQQLCQRDLHHFGIPAAELWENAVATAAAAELLAPGAGMDPGLAYTSGLLRNLGRVILEDMATELYPGPATVPVLSDWERARFGLTAAEVTAMLLDHWRFPVDVVEAVRGHLDPLASTTSNVGAGILNLAGGIASVLGLGLPGEAAHWIQTSAKLTLTGITEAMLEDCTTKTRDHYCTLCGSIS